MKLPVLSLSLALLFTIPTFSQKKPTKSSRISDQKVGDGGSYAVFGS
jgi:hypothetical protein